METPQGMYNGYFPAADGTPVKLPAKFYWKEKKLSDNPPQFTKVPYTLIFLHGGDTVDRPTRDQDKFDYPREWASFQAGEEQSKVGWAIEHAPFLDVAQVATYKALNIFTMEGLATAPDTSLQNLMGAFEHRKRAQLMLKQAADGKPLMELAEQNKGLQDEVSLLRAQIAELCAEMTSLKEAKEQSPLEKATTSKVKNQFPSKEEY